MGTKETQSDESQTEKTEAFNTENELYDEYDSEAKSDGKPDLEFETDESKKDDKEEEEKKETEEKEDKEEKEEEKETEESEEEEEKEPSKEDSELTDRWDDEVELVNDKNEKVTLSIFKFDDGSFGYVPKGKEKGFMMQADYTKKTQALADQRRGVEAREASINKKAGDIEGQIEPYKLALLAREVGATYNGDGQLVIGQFNTPEPKREDYVTSDDAAERIDQSEEYREAKDKWARNKEKFEHNVAIFKSNYQKANQKNAETIQKFDDMVKKDYPNLNVSSDILLDEISNYVSSSITRGQQAFPEDTLKIFFLGTRFDEIVKKVIEPSIRKKVLAEITKETSEGKKIPVKHPRKTKVTKTKSKKDSFKDDPVYSAVEEIGEGTW